MCSEKNQDTVVAYSVTFPHIYKGAIRSVCIGSWSRKNQSYRLEQSEVEGLVNEIENTKIIKKLPDSAFENMTRIKTNILILNSHGEFRTVCVTSYGKGYHEITSEKDFAAIKEATMTMEGEKEGKKLSEEEISLLKKCVKEKQKTMNNPYGHDCYFDCVLEDGSYFHFSLCSDGESMSTDKNVYVIDKSKTEKLAELLKR